MRAGNRRRINAERGTGKKLIIAVSVFQNRKDFDCKSCKWGRHCDDSNPAPMAQFVLPGIAESRTCFLPMISERSLHYIRLHKHYTNGVLAKDGGLLSQPAAYIAAMDTIEGAIE